MKILALVTDGFGARGGIAQYNRDLARALGSLGGVESVRVLPRRGEPSSPAATQEAAIPGRVRYSLRALRLAMSWRPDVIFCGHLFMAPLAWLLATLLRKPLWLQLHGIEAWEKPGRLVRFAAERASLVTAVSRYTRLRFLGWARVAPDAVKVLPNTCDRAAVSPATRAVARQQLGLEGRQVLLTVARAESREAYKGHDRVIAVLAHLIREFPGLAYVIAGDGDDVPRLRALASSHGVPDRVRFAGPLDDARLKLHYRAADVFVMPSSGEGFGIAYLEAAAHGLPVVGSRLAGAPDALADGEIGALAPADPDGLSAAIAAALRGGLQDPARGRRFDADSFRAHLASLQLLHAH